MAKTVNLESRLIKATRRIPRPRGVTGPSRVFRGEDHTGDDAVWFDFDIDDDENSDPVPLLDFWRRVREAAVKVDPAVIPYVRFVPVVATAR
jgi:hypothetical protein